MAVIGDIQRIIDIAVDKLVGRLSNSSETLLFINLIPFIGITEFQEPKIEIENEILYSKHSNQPQAVVEKNTVIGDASITMLESSLVKAKLSGFYLSNEISLTKLIHGGLRQQDFRELKLYTGVIPVSEERPQLNHELMAYTVDIGLKFTAKPLSIPIPI
jgi:hypothetical protein